MSKIVVITPEHLDRALKENLPFHKCCIVAQAIRDVDPDYLYSIDGVFTWLGRHDATRREELDTIIRHFDMKRYEEVRRLLPFSFNASERPNYE